jgi:hypothetical protein
MHESNDGEAESSISKYSSNINDSLTSENVLRNSFWEIGQLAWARMSIYPFWPCMITFDPNSLMAFQKVQSKFGYNYKIIFTQNWFFFL